MSDFVQIIDHFKKQLQQAVFFLNKLIVVIISDAPCMSLTVIK